MHCTAEELVILKRDGHSVCIAALSESLGHIMYTYNQFKLANYYAKSHATQVR